MSNFSPAYFSTINNVTTAFTDRTALSLPEMKKNILTAYHATTQFAPRALYQMTNSFSARFPASITITPSYQVPGTRLTGQTPPARNFRDIILDDRLVVHLFIDELDANARAIVPFAPMFALEMGQAISQYDDQNAAIIAVLAARSAATVSGGQAGVQITKTACDVNIGALNAAIWDSKNALDEHNTPGMGRAFGLRPAQFNLIASSLDRVFFRGLGQDQGSLGGHVSIPGYAGYEEIFMSNNLPSTNIASSPTGTHNTYAGNFTTTVGIGFGYQAFGTVVSSHNMPQGGNQQPSPTGQDTASQVQPLDVREVAIPEAYGSLMLASLVTGHGILRPESAVEVLTQ